MVLILIELSGILTVSVICDDKVILMKHKHNYGHENEMYNVGVELKDVECL